MNTNTFIVAAVAACGLGGFANLARAQECCSAKTDVVVDSKMEQDRQAILAMAGEYKVRFQFHETVPLVEGYEFHDPKDSGATEFVEVIVDEPGLIDLQHVLVMGSGEDARVVKHWRQTWTYEDDFLTTYKGNNTWETVELSDEEAVGTWTQFVYQVDDSPRYESVGTWVHDNGVSVWEGNETWRPLPRREYTKRSDYDVMGCVNRHIVTPTGWVHEQENQKIVLAEDGTVEKILVRESGLNTYDRFGYGIADGETHDFTAGRAYWAKTSDFWSDVREAWSEKLDTTGTVTLKTEVEDKKLWQHMFGYANDLASGETFDTQASKQFVQETLDAFEAIDRTSADKGEGEALR
jgi:hypothetical protein